MRVRDAVRQEIHHEVKRPRHSLNLGVFFSLLFCQVLGFLRNKTKHGQKRRRRKKKTVDQRWQRCVSSGVSFRYGTSSFYITAIGEDILSCLLLTYFAFRVELWVRLKDASRRITNTQINSGLFFLPSIGKEDTVVWVVCLHGSMFDFRLSCCIWQTTRVLSFIFCLDIKKENINLRLMAL